MLFRGSVEYLDVYGQPWLKLSTLDGGQECFQLNLKSGMFSKADLLLWEKHIHNPSSEVVSLDELEFLRLAFASRLSVFGHAIDSLDGSIQECQKQLQIAKNDSLDESVRKLSALLKEHFYKYETKEYTSPLLSFFVKEQQSS
jgi:hypothetical protein